MQQLEFSEVKGLVKQLELIRDQADQDKESVTTMYSNFDPEKDARITAFSKMINVFYSVELALIFAAKHLLDPNWWKVTYPKLISVSYAKTLANEFVGFSKLGFVQFLFSTTESSLRLFLRTLDPMACSRGTAEFKSVYECLLRSNLSTCPSESIELLKLLRLVRNTIHNNGVFFPRNGRNDSVTWHGTTYRFRQFAPVDFVTWGFLLEVSDATRRLMYTVVADDKLKAVTNTIPDPFAS